MIKRITLVALILFIAITGTVSWLDIPVKVVRALADNYTLSHKGHTTWLGIITTNSWYHESIIEKTLRRSNIEIENKWVSYEGTRYSIFNRVIVRGHGSPNELAINGRSQWFNDELARFSDGELVGIYNGLRSNNKYIIKDTMKRILP